MHSAIRGWYDICMSSMRYHNEFDDMNGREKSAVFEVFPRVFKDDRGYFLEVAKELDEMQN